MVEVDYSATGTVDSTYSYDAVGRLVATTDSTGTSSFGYDAAGRLLSETNGAGATIGYAYGDLGELSSITYPGSRVASYAYDAAGRMTSVTDWLDNTTAFSWTADGQLAERAYPNGVVQTNDYDLVGQLTEIAVANGATSLAEFGYSYDAAGQLTGDSSAAAGSTVEHVNSYDLLKQLAGRSTALDGGSPTSTSYDATPAGLLTATALGEVLSYNAAQQLTAVTPVSGPATSLTYDARGSRSSSTLAATETTEAVTTSYGYTPWGALASVEAPAATVGYSSDAAGLRQSRTAGGVTQQFTWSSVGGMPLLLDDGVRSYVYGPSSAPIEQVDASGAVGYLHGDLLGSTRLVTDEAGAAVGAASYDAFGSPESVTGAASAFGYTGNWTDPDTGLVYLRARDYDPATGQFLVVDPALDQTGQPYAYTSNNPLLHTDPTGLCVGIEGSTQERPCTYNDYFWDGLPGAIGENLLASWAGAADGVGFNVPILLDCTSYRKYKDNPSYWAGNVVGVLTAVLTFTVAFDLRVGTAVLSRPGAASAAAATGARSTPMPQVLRVGDVKLPAVPAGAVGTPVSTGNGLQYAIPAGTPELSKNVVGIRVMNPVTSGRYQYPNGYAVYMNTSGQTISPLSGETISNSDPFAHIPLP